MKAQEKIIVTVDLVLLCVVDGRLNVALFKRDREPEKGLFALLGGYVHSGANEDATAFHAAQRVLKDKAGLKNPFLSQFAAFSGASRDPRGWSVSIDYYSLVHPSALEASTAEYLLAPVDDLPAMPFDHAAITARAVEYVRLQGRYSSLPVYLCKDEFTLPQLQHAYEVLFGEERPKAQFRRKMTELNFIQQVKGKKDDSYRAHGGPSGDIWRLRPEFRRSVATVNRPI